MNKQLPDDWKVIKLGDIAEFRNGINYDKTNFGTGIKIIGVKDFQDYFHPIYSSLHEMNPIGIVRPESVLKENDILFVRSNGNRKLIGRSLFIKGINEPVTHSAFTIRARISSQNALAKFYFYLFRTSTIRELFSNQGSGTNISNLNQDILSKLPVPLPPLSTQQKIAAILSAYDDLIENNTQRIKILEEMAQAIYREWFVNFRFPGHQGVRWVESELGPVPEGWEVKRLDDVTEVIDCLHGIKPTEVTDDDEKFGILLHVWNIGEEGKLELSKNFFITEEVYRLWTKRIEVKGGDCVITNVGRIGAVAQIPFDLKAAIGRNMTAIRCREGIITPTYLIEYLRSPYFVREKNLKQDSGTIMGSLNVKGIVRLNIPIPPFNLVKEFETVVRSFRYRIEIFQKQNANLRRTRDLLLPKLISGEFDVSELDIRIPEAET